MCPRMNLRMRLHRLRRRHRPSLRELHRLARPQGRVEGHGRPEELIGRRDSAESASRLSSLHSMFHPRTFLPSFNRPTSNMKTKVAG